jgi:hypothetical protein
MAPTTRGISDIDLSRRSEWIPFIAPYSSYHDDPTGDTTGIILPSEADVIHVPGLVRSKDNTASVKSSLEWEMLLNVPSNLLSFLSKRRQLVLNGYTYETIVEPEEIELLRCVVKTLATSRSFAIPLSREAEAFCCQQGIREYVTLVSSLLNQCFSDIRDVDSEVLQDPDTGDRLLVIHMEVKGEIEEILDMYDKYTEEIISRIPWPERGKINLSYIII